MTDQLNGLRFDIYERVHLPDDVAAIEELEEIELVPHMQALPQDDQVLLRGHLLLTGIYRSLEAANSAQLEHWIPVEISLPLNRIQSVEQLAVEVDNFDVDLISNRSLNVTGVLALRGLQIQAQQTPIWHDDSFTVVHQTEPEKMLEELLPSYERIQDERNSFDSNSYASNSIDSNFSDPTSYVSDTSEPISYASNSSASNSSDPYAYESISSDTNDYSSGANLGLEEQERVDDWSLQAETEELPEESAKESNWLAMFQNLEGARKDPEIQAESQESEPLATSLWGDLSSKAEEEVVVEPLVVKEEVEKPDLRVALGGKPLESIQLQQSGVGLLAQLGEKGAKREADQKLLEAAKAEENAQALSNPTVSTGDELEWTRLFLINGGEAQSFRKVKMCIVQREETLELIANRYNVQPRELQLYNRLHDPYLSEGQVIYIP